MNSAAGQRAFRCLQGQRRLFTFRLTQRPWNRLTTRFTRCCRSAAGDFWASPSRPVVRFCPALRLISKIEEIGGSATRKLAGPGPGIGT